MYVYVYVYVYLYVYVYVYVYVHVYMYIYIYIYICNSMCMEIHRKDVGELSPKHCGELCWFETRIYHRMFFRLEAITGFPDIITSEAEAMTYNDLSDDTVGGQ